MHIKMTGEQLRLFRKIMMISAEIAAEHIGCVKLAQWLRWEHNTSPVPSRVVKRVLQINAQRQEYIKKILCSEKYRGFEIDNDGCATIKPFHTIKSIKLKRNGVNSVISDETLEAGVNAYLFEQLLELGLSDE